MGYSIKKNKDDLLFLPLGGAGEIGLNLNLYHYEGKWLIVDFGAGFAEDYLPGIDMLVPDISFIKENKDNFLGIVLTHAHEDHLGAVHYLIDEINFPIYATPFTASFLRAKLSENGVDTNSVKIIEIEPGGQMQIGPFDIQMIQLTHSAPEMNAAFIKTKHGNIFHSGDWKLDPKPLVGPSSDIDMLKKIGNDGVLAMVGDSTNVFSAGTSGSEGDLRDSLIDLVSDCKKMVMVTTFASNVARLESIIVAAQKAGRQVIISGRSLWRIINSAREAGYLTDCPELHDQDSFSKFSREKVLVIATGCQGEPMATVNKVTSGSHRFIKFLPGDSIIFSSKIIPGNDKRIFRLFNKLVQIGVGVLTEKDHFVHVSGHPNRDDLKQMYEYVKPKIAIPVHGEDVHMHEHVKLAESFGVKHAIKIENGCMIKLAPGNPEKIANVKSGALAVDGNCLLESDCKIIRMRRKLQKEGGIFINLVIDNNYLVTEPIIFAPGILDEKDDIDIFDSLIEAISFAYDGYIRAINKKDNKERLYNVIRAAVRKIIRAETGKEPTIEIKFSRL